MNEENILGTPLFFAGTVPDGFLCAPPVPIEWGPGSSLILYGPLGNRFQIPASTTRLAMIAAGDNLSRLLPLVGGISTAPAVALFTNAPLPQLPATLEAFPLDEFSAALDWAEFLAIDTPVEKLPEIKERLGGYFKGTPLISGQVLVHSAMPCAGLGECGVCAIQTNHTSHKRQPAWKLTCRDGPVFNLEDLI
jgi:hypothetical protein